MITYVVLCIIAIIMSLLTSLSYVLIVLCDYTKYLKCRNKDDNFYRKIFST